MNRQLKFRAWHKTRHKLLPVVKINWFRVGDDRFEVTVKDESDFGGEYLWLYHEIELMQSTGLTDKNGKEIHESDIIYDEDREHLYIIEQRDWGWGCKPINYDDSYPALTSGTMDSYVVIGNIHQNPELLSSYPENPEDLDKNPQTSKTKP